METSEQQRRPTIRQFAGGLKHAGIDLNAFELADIFWLAQFLESKTLADNLETVQELQNNNQEESDKTSSTVESKSTDITFDLYSDAIHQSESINQSESISSESSNFQQENTAKSKDPEPGMPFPAPAAPALRTRLDLARSFKPLMRKVPSKTHFDLDEEATVTYIAETSIRMAVERPRPERWLDLELVVEGSKTTVLWEKAITELQDLTQYQGAFRTVRTWRLDALNRQIRLFPRWNSLPKNQQTLTTCQRPRNPREIIDPGARRLILLISDCTSQLWRQGIVHKTLYLWSEKQPVAVVQMLPERLWSRTALSNGHRTPISSMMPGLPNKQLEIHELPNLTEYDNWDLEDIDSENGEHSLPEYRDQRLLSLPIITLTPDSLGRWAKVIAGIGDTRIPGRTFELSVIDELANEISPLAALGNRTARQRVALFQANASEIAQKLATLMAATPVSLPVIDLLRDEFLPEAEQAHVAEVLLSGLLQRQDEEDENLCRYEFYGYESPEPENQVRNLLLDGLPTDKAFSVLDRLSRLINTRTGRTINNFLAFLSLYKKVPKEFDDAALPFAKVGLNTLKRLGGDYAKLANQYDSGQRSNPKMTQLILQNSNLTK